MIYFPCGLNLSNRIIMCFPIKKGDYPVMKKTLKVVSAMLAVLLILLSFAGCNMFTIGEESMTTTEYSTSLTENPRIPQRQ